MNGGNNLAVLRKLNMKVDYDVFESITAKKAEKSYVDLIVGLAFETKKSQKAVLSIVTEILKLMEVKVEDAIHTKQKKIPLLIAQVKTIM